MNYEILVNLAGPAPTLRWLGHLSATESDAGWSLLDGWGTQNPNAGNELDEPGVFNHVEIDRRQRTVRARNDVLGQRPLYAGSHAGQVVLADDLWTVAERLQALGAPVDVDECVVDQLRDFRRILPTHRTLISGIHRLPAGTSMLFAANSDYPEIRTERLLTQHPDDRITLADAVEELHRAMLDGFESLSCRHANSDIWFGNSGGLDSRVIPAYAALMGLDLKGFLVSNQRRLRSLTDLAAERVCERFDFPFRKLAYDQDAGWPRLLRDIRVSPGGPPNFHKNPSFEMFRDAVVINGGNSFLITNDDNAWSRFMEESDPVTALCSQHLTRSHVGVAQASDYTELLRKELYSSGIEYDGFSTCRIFHQRVLNATSPMGAFESMSFCGDFHYIYHPWITETTRAWPRALFFDRQVQSAFLRTKWPELLTIPDQTGTIPGRAPGQLGRLGQRIRRRVRRTGLDYRNWINSSWCRETVSSASHYLKTIGDDRALEILRGGCLADNPNDFLTRIKLAVTHGVIMAGDWELLKR